MRALRILPLAVVLGAISALVAPAASSASRVIPSVGEGPGWVCGARTAPTALPAPSPAPGMTKSRTTAHVVQPSFHLAAQPLTGTATPRAPAA